MQLPLDGVTVLEFSQYLAGPYAGLRLADLGARVIKIERPGTGDACRQLATKDMVVDGDSLLFHTINRNKESFSADLKSAEDLEAVKGLIRRADVMTHNFRPGVMEKLGLDYASVKTLNGRIIYGEVSGYGKTGPWKDKPGQDLLAQSLSGLTWLTGVKAFPPTPFGLAVADMMCGTHLAQGILAALVRRQRANVGALIEVSLLESMVDFQFEGLTTYLNNGRVLPARSRIANAHALLEAPYGIYKTSDGYIAIAMTSLPRLAEAIQCDAIAQPSFVRDPFGERDNINRALQDHFGGDTTRHWLDLLEPLDIWCSDVFTYAILLQHAAYRSADMELTVERDSGVRVKTTRCPIQLNGRSLKSPVAAPVLGSANEALGGWSS